MGIPGKTKDVGWVRRKRDKREKRRGVKILFNEARETKMAAYVNA